MVIQSKSTYSLVSEASEICMATGVKLQSYAEEKKKRPGTQITNHLTPIMDYTLPQI